MYQVTMKNTVEGPGGVVWAFEATDRVPATDLDAYVIDARTRWGMVDVSEIQEN